MKICSIVAVVLLMSGCTVVSPAREACASVGAVKSNPEACAGRSIRVKAYLVSTRHGEYLVDTPDGTEVLSAEISESASHAEDVSKLLEKLAWANKGKPTATVYGVFEGRLVVNARGEPIKLEIYSEVH